MVQLGATLYSGPACGKLDASAPRPDDHVTTPPPVSLPSINNVVLNTKHPANDNNNSINSYNNIKPWSTAATCAINTSTTSSTTSSTSSQPELADSSEHQIILPSIKPNGVVLTNGTSDAISFPGTGDTTSVLLDQSDKQSNEAAALANVKSKPLPICKELESVSCNTVGQETSVVIESESVSSIKTSCPIASSAGAQRVLDNASYSSRVSVECQEFTEKTNDSNSSTSCSPSSSVDKTDACAVVSEETSNNSDSAFGCSDTDVNNTDSLEDNSSSPDSVLSNSCSPFSATDAFEKLGSINTAELPCSTNGNWRIPYKDSSFPPIKDSCLSRVSSDPENPTLSSDSLSSVTHIVNSTIDPAATITNTIATATVACVTNSSSSSVVATVTTNTDSATLEVEAVDSSSIGCTQVSEAKNSTHGIKSNNTQVKSRKRLNQLITKFFRRAPSIINKSKASGLKSGCKAGPKSRITKVEQSTKPSQCSLDTSIESVDSEICCLDNEESCDTAERQTRLCPAEGELVTAETQALSGQAEGSDVIDLASEVDCVDISVDCISDADISLQQPVLTSSPAKTNSATKSGDTSILDITTADDSITEGVSLCKDDDAEQPSRVRSSTPDSIIELSAEDPFAALEEDVGDLDADTSIVALDADCVDTGHEISTVDASTSSLTPSSGDKDKTRDKKQVTEADSVSLVDNPLLVCLDDSITTIVSNDDNDDVTVDDESPDDSSTKVFALPEPEPSSIRPSTSVATTDVVIISEDLFSVLAAPPTKDTTEENDTDEKKLEGIGDRNDVNAQDTIDEEEKIDTTTDVNEVVKGLVEESSGKVTNLPAKVKEISTTRRLRSSPRNTPRNSPIPPAEASLVPQEHKRNTSPCPSEEEPLTKSCQKQSKPQTLSKETENSEADKANYPISADASTAQPDSKELDDDIIPKTSQTTSNKGTCLRSSNRSTKFSSAACSKSLRSRQRKSFQSEVLRNSTADTVNDKNPTKVLQQEPIEELIKEQSLTDQTEKSNKNPSNNICKKILNINLAQSNEESLLDVNLEITESQEHRSSSKKNSSSNCADSTTTSKKSVPNNCNATDSDTDTVNSSPLVKRLKARLSSDTTTQNNHKAIRKGVSKNCTSVVSANSTSVTSSTNIVTNSIDALDSINSASSKSCQKIASTAPSISGCHITSTTSCPSESVPRRTTRSIKDGNPSSTISSTSKESETIITSNQSTIKGTTSNSISSTTSVSTEVPTSSCSSITTSRKRQDSCSSGSSSNNTASSTVEVDVNTSKPNPKNFQENCNTSNKTQEMVRLVQEHSNPFDSYCRRRGNRTSRRLCSADAAVDCLKKKSSRKNVITSGSRSDYYSESEESCVGDENKMERRSTFVDGNKSSSMNIMSTFTGGNDLGNHTIDKMATRRMLKNGSDLPTPVEVVASALEATVAATNKCNGDARAVVAGLINGSSITTCNNSKRFNNGSHHRAGSEDSDASSVATTLRVGGSAFVDPATDKVDINMLLEISVADRNKFEKKKAKIKRKTSDWCLISETEKYINEKQEILQNKNRPDSSSDDDDNDSKDSDDSRNFNMKMTNRDNSRVPVEHHSSEDSESNLYHDLRRKVTRKEHRAKEKLITETESRTRSKLNNSTQLPSKSENKLVEEGKQSKNCKQDTPLRLPKALASEDAPTPRAKGPGRPRGSRNRKTLYDLTRLHEDTDDDNFLSFPVNSGLGNSPVTTLNSRCSRSKTLLLESAEKEDKDGNAASKKRLSDAERFLRDNKEYYQFPETVERLRTSHEKGDDQDNDDSNDDDTESEQELEEKIEQLSKRSRLRGSIPSPSKASLKSNKISNERLSRGRGCKLKRSTKEDDLEKVNKTFNKLSKSSVSDSDNASTKDLPHPGYVYEMIPTCTDAVDKLRFSFEQVPEGEPWYQTYQRQINGNKENEYCKEDDQLRFILPYEMPKEYFRDHVARRNLANKKRVDLAELVRKSPRCHASTMALFSDILPVQRKNSRRSRSATNAANSSAAKDEDQNTSDGTCTPGAVEIPMSRVPPVGEHFETLDDYLAIEHCMHLVLRAAVENKEISHLDVFRDDADTDNEANDDVKKKDEDSKPGGHNDSKKELRDSRTEVKDSKRKENSREDSDYSDPEPKKELRDMSRNKNKRKRQASTNSNSSKAPKLEKPNIKEEESDKMDPIQFLKDLNLQDDPLAIEVDPNFLLEMKDFQVDGCLFGVEESTFDQSSADLYNSSSSCKCTIEKAHPTYDDLSSLDDNTEASSECMSLVDSDKSSSHFSRLIVKKRRKNLTGWPKTKRKRSSLAAAVLASASIPASDDNDSSMGFDDHVNALTTSGRKRARTTRSDGRCDDRRASPRKRGNGIYAHSLPLRFRR